MIGGGISGLVCAQQIKHLSDRTVDVILLEASHRLGGQIYTQQHILENKDSVIVETGAEGFVFRSTIFPKIAKTVGLVDFVNQARIADKELRQSGGKWTIHDLAPGVAAEKLGFQVPAADRGKGIRTFTGGMSRLVDSLAAQIDTTRMNASVASLEVGSTSVRIGYTSNGTASLISVDAAVLAAPMGEIREILSSSVLQPEEIPSDVLRNNHVSIHLLVPSQATTMLPSSFTVPESLQASLKGLRAMSFVNEKFPGRCSEGNWLFRFYFRPDVSVSLIDGKHWEDGARVVLENVFGIKQFTWCHFAPWKQTLPILSADHLSRCAKFKHLITERSHGRVYVAGSDVSGAGLDVAATSGYEAAVNVLKRLGIVVHNSQ